MLRNLPQDKLLSPSIKWATPSLNFLFQGTRAQFIFVKYLPPLANKFIMCLCLSGFLSKLEELHAVWQSVYTHTQICHLPAGHLALLAHARTACLPQISSTLFSSFGWSSKLISTPAYFPLPLFSGGLNHILIHLYSSFIIVAVQQLYLAHKWFLY